MTRSSIAWLAGLALLGALAAIVASRHATELFAPTVATPRVPPHAGTSPRIRAEMQGNGMPSCESYVAFAETYLACDKVPKESRDVMAEGLRLMKAARGAGRILLEADQEVDAACKYAEESLRKRGREMGCDL